MTRYHPSIPRKTWSPQTTSLTWWRLPGTFAPASPLPHGTTFRVSFKQSQGGAPHIHEYTPLMTKWDMEDMHLSKHCDEPPTMLQPELLKWRHWKPSALKDEEPTAQRALEVYLRSRWTARLLAHFAPYAQHIPSFA
eukprot:s2867_g5.t1